MKGFEVGPSSADEAGRGQVSEGYGEQYWRGGEQVDEGTEPGDKESDPAPASELTVRARGASSLLPLWACFLANMGDNAPPTLQRSGAQTEAEGRLKDCANSLGGRAVEEIKGSMVLAEPVQLAPSSACSGACPTSPCCLGSCHCSYHSCSLPGSSATPLPLYVVGTSCSSPGPLSPHTDTRPAPGTQPSSIPASSGHPSGPLRDLPVWEPQGR